MPEFASNRAQLTLSRMLILKNYRIEPSIVQEPRQLMELLTENPNDINIIVSKGVSNRSVSFSSELRARLGYAPVQLTHRNNDQQSPHFLKYDIESKNRRTILINDLVSLEFVDELCNMILKSRKMPKRHIRLFVEGATRRNEIWRTSDFGDKLLMKIVSGRLQVFFLMISPVQIMAILSEVK